MCQFLGLSRSHPKGTLVDMIFDFKTGQNLLRKIGTSFRKDNNPNSDL
jgi:hypothetical protein